MNKTGSSSRQRAVALAGILALGMSGMMGQVLLWYELLITYTGNELSLGFILANWLLSEATGALVCSRFLLKRLKPFFLYAGLTALFCFSLAMGLLMARMWRYFLELPIAYPVGLTTLAWTSWLILLVPAFAHGALFPAASALYASWFPTLSFRTVRNVYIWETLGTLVGGVLCRLFLSAHIASYHWVAVLALVNLLALLGWRPVHRAHESQEAVWRLGKVMWVGSLAILAAVSVASFGLESFTVARQWQPYKVLAHRNSPRGHVAVLQHEGQYMFLADGAPAVLTSAPDRIHTEELVHLPLALHPHPEQVAVIGNAVGGFLAEILKHENVRRIDYVESHRALINLLKRFPTALTASELNDARVHIHTEDGPRFLRHTLHTFDVIWVGYAEPSTLQMNRHFTVEFFSAAIQKLTDAGLLVIRLPSSLSLTSDALRRLNASIYLTMKSVFPVVWVLPGDGQNVFVGIKMAPFDPVNAVAIADRLRIRRIYPDGQLPWYMEKRLHPGWQPWFAAFIENVAAAPNHALRPCAVFHAIMRWQHIHSPSLARTLNRLVSPEWVWKALGILALAAAGFWFWIRTRSDVMRYAAPGVIIITGFTGMTAELLVLLSFQSTLGYVYPWVGLLVAAYMAGAMAGASWLSDTLMAHVTPVKGLQILEGTLAGWCLALPIIMGRLLHLGFGEMSSLVLFLALSMVSGLLTGACFPTAAALKTIGPASQTAGILLASDLLGGWCAGMIVAGFLLPLAGVAGACWVSAALNVAGLLLLTCASSRRKLVNG